jgi:choline dehydrogenase
VFLKRDNSPDKEKPEVYEHYFRPHLSDRQQWTIGLLCILLHPKSKGETILAIRDPLLHPVINPNYLEDEEDFRKLVEACKLTDKICRTEPLNRALKSIAKEMNADEKNRKRRSILGLLRSEV